MCFYLCNVKRANQKENNPKVLSGVAELERQKKKTYG